MLERPAQPAMDFVRQFRLGVGKNYYRKLFLANENDDETLSSGNHNIVLVF